MLAAATLVGCVSPRFDEQPPVVAINEPVVGTVATVAIGDAVLRAGAYTQIEILRLMKDFCVGTFGCASYRLRAGDYDKQGGDDRSEYFLPGSDHGHGYIVAGSVVDPPKAIQAYRDRSRICVVTVFNLAVCRRWQGAERATRRGAESFEYALIYSGRVGDRLRLGYRESRNDLARPAFYNEVEYDLSESPVIGYKGARIEVIKATNESITYRVVRSFDLSSETRAP